ncbi:hypothetical protein [Embleya hyalina]|uniref:Lipoprotein n=1 Tax=Embleya hyalina TaxID=516124 RepID=A0A401Z093_9ACTN|nr:hypothetical protein [Embleya hyalina]GCE00196.1 hypothetical protein EHYA_07921 [Embleya hyalina]
MGGRRVTVGTAWMRGVVVPVVMAVAATACGGSGGGGYRRPHADETPSALPWTGEGARLTLATVRTRVAVFRLRVPTDRWVQGDSAAVSGSFCPGVRVVVNRGTAGPDLVIQSFGTACDPRTMPGWERLSPKDLYRTESDIPTDRPVETVTTSLGRAVMFAGTGGEPTAVVFLASPLLPDHPTLVIRTGGQPGLFATTQLADLLRNGLLPAT